jgi:hypothetical protein
MGIFMLETLNEKVRLRMLLNAANESVALGIV